MSPVMKRIGGLAVLVLAVGACDYGLNLSPDPAASGDEVTVTNAPDGPVCEVPPVEPSAAGAAAGVPVDVFVLTDLEVTEEPVPTSVVTDDEGFFTATVDAPVIPGQHLVVAVCGGIAGPMDAQALAAAAEPVDEDGTIVDLLQVGQAPLTISLSDDAVEEGDEVVATFNRCQDENDFNLFTGLAPTAEPTPEELAADHPDLEVFLDGELVDTIEGTERYPTGTVDVPLTLDEVGEHEISGICTYQTFDLDVEAIIEEIGGGELPIEVLDGASAAAIDYPFDPAQGLFVWDEATTQAAGTVVVSAADVGGAGSAPDPVPATPTYTG